MATFHEGTPVSVAGACNPCCDPAGIAGWICCPDDLVSSEVALKITGSSGSGSSLAMATPLLLTYHNPSLIYPVGPPYLGMVGGASDWWAADTPGDYFWPADPFASRGITQIVLTGLIGNFELAPEPRLILYVSLADRPDVIGWHVFKFHCESVACGPLLGGGVGAESTVEGFGTYSGITFDLAGT